MRKRKQETKFTHGNCVEKQKEVKLKLLRTNQILYDMIII